MVLLELALEVGVLKPKLMLGVVFVLRIGALEFLAHKFHPIKKPLSHHGWRVASAEAPRRRSARYNRDA